MKDLLSSLANRIVEFFTAKPETVFIQQAPNQLPLEVLKPVDDIPAIGKRNAYIVSSLTKTKDVAVRLARSGFHVIDISVGGRNPKIIINPCKRCSLLGGAVIKKIPLVRSEVRTLAANIAGVQVEWHETHEYQ